MLIVKRFVAYFYFVGWDCLNFGVSVCLGLPNIEIHIPFGFIRIGWINTFPDAIRLTAVDEYAGRRTYGLDAP